MSEEENKKSEERLRRYAQERRREAGGDWEMPRVTANLLRAESERRWGRARARSSRVAGGWLPWGLAFGLCLVLGLVWAVDRRSRETRTALLGRSERQRAAEPGQAGQAPASGLLPGERALSEGLSRALQPPAGPRVNARGVPAKTIVTDTRWSEQFLVMEKEARKQTDSNGLTTNYAYAPPPPAASPSPESANLLLGADAVTMGGAAAFSSNNPQATTWFFKRASASEADPSDPSVAATRRSIAPARDDLALNQAASRAPEARIAQDRNLSYAPSAPSIGGGALGVSSALRSSVGGGAVGVSSTLRRSNTVSVAVNQKTVDGLARSLAATNLGGSVTEKLSDVPTLAAVPPPPGPSGKRGGLAGEESVKLATARAKESSPVNQIEGGQLPALGARKPEQTVDVESRAGNLPQPGISPPQSVSAAKPPDSTGIGFRVLDSFNLTRQGKLMTITDSDGSVYRGNVETAENVEAALVEAPKNQPAGRKPERVANGVARNYDSNTTTTFALGSSSSDLRQAAAAQGTPFQVRGTNISTQEEVAFDGYLADGESEQLKELSDGVRRGAAPESNALGYGLRVRTGGGGVGGAGGRGGGGAEDRAAGDGLQKSVDQTKPGLVASQNAAALSRNGTLAVTNAVAANAGSGPSQTVFGRVTLGKTNQMEIRANGVAAPAK
jgi:hypothetical protein